MGIKEKPALGGL